MSTSITSSNLTSGFIDLATYDELEKYLYGGVDSLTYFVRRIRKSSWFTTVPVTLTPSSGTGSLGQQFSVNISRAGDYLLACWLRITWPAIVFVPGDDDQDGYVRWTRNLMHNLIDEASITFNDLVAMRLDKYFLDSWANFTIPASKKDGYDNMIGNYFELTNPRSGGGSALGVPTAILNLPLPMCFFRDSGVSLPTAAIPYNEMRLNFRFDTLQDLLVGVDLTSTPPAQMTYTQLVATNAGSAISPASPALTTVDVWAEYAIVSNNERMQMGQIPRDIVIEQVQTARIQTITNYVSFQQDIRFSQAVKALFFYVQDTTLQCDQSNYTADEYGITSVGSIEFETATNIDPISNASLLYENTLRLTQMGVDYFSLIQPFYKAPSIPTLTGYHLYSYTLNLVALDPMGSTNYGKLTNVTIAYQFASSFETIATKEATDEDYRGPQTYQSIVCAMNHNVVRVSGGALGFPVL